MVCNGSMDRQGWGGWAGAPDLDPGLRDATYASLAGWRRRLEGSRGLSNPVAIQQELAIIGKEAGDLPDVARWRAGRARSRSTSSASQPRSAGHPAPWPKRWSAWRSTWPPPSLASFTASCSRRSPSRRCSTCRRPGPAVDGPSPDPGRDAAFGRGPRGGPRRGPPARRRPRSRRRRPSSRRSLREPDRSRPFVCPSRWHHRSPSRASWGRSSASAPSGERRPDPSGPLPAAGAKGPTDVLGLRGRPKSAANPSPGLPGSSPALPGPPGRRTAPALGEPPGPRTARRRATAQGSRGSSGEPPLPGWFYAVGGGLAVLVIATILIIVRSVRGSNSAPGAGAEAGLDATSPRASGPASGAGPTTHSGPANLAAGPAGCRFGRHDHRHISASRQGDTRAQGLARDPEPPRPGLPERPRVVRPRMDSAVAATPSTRSIAAVSSSNPRRQRPCRRGSSGSSCPPSFPSATTILFARCSTSTRRTSRAASASRPRSSSAPRTTTSSTAPS